MLKRRKRARLEGGDVPLADSEGAERVERGERRIASTTAGPTDLSAVVRLAPLWDLLDRPSKAALRIVGRAPCDAVECMLTSVHVDPEKPLDQDAMRLACRLPSLSTMAWDSTGKGTTAAKGSRFVGFLAAECPGVAGKIQRLSMGLSDKQLDRKLPTALTVLTALQVRAGQGGSRLVHAASHACGLGGKAE